MKSPIPNLQILAPKTSCGGLRKCQSRKFIDSYKSPANIKISRKYVKEVTSTILFLQTMPTYLHSTKVKNVGEF